MMAFSSVGLFLGLRLLLFLVTPSSLPLALAVVVPSSDTLSENVSLSRASVASDGLKNTTTPSGSFLGTASNISSIAPTSSKDLGTSTSQGPAYRNSSAAFHATSKHLVDAAVPPDSYEQSPFPASSSAVENNAASSTSPNHLAHQVLSTGLEQVAASSDTSEPLSNPILPEAIDDEATPSRSLESSSQPGLPKGVGNTAASSGFLGLPQHPSRISNRIAPATLRNVTSKSNSTTCLSLANGNISTSGNGSIVRPHYWVASIQRKGKAPFLGNSTAYSVFRNVKDYGAEGDGVTDDTIAINDAIAAGGRCGKGCDSSTTKPALVYFPPGTYIVSRPIIQLYYTQFVGDAASIPTLKAAPSFKGMAVIDSDPYEAGGVNWYTNQNNFFRQIRNFVIDLTSMPPSSGTGIHWQVAQATSLQNIRFEMIRGGGDDNKQQGIFMENGSGGFMANLTFNGGNYGAFLGNQQFTTRDLTFNGCNTAIFMNWNWLWAFKSVHINDCRVGIDMTNVAGDTGLDMVGSVLLQDSKIANTSVGILSSWSTSSRPIGGSTLVIDNVLFKDCPAAVSSRGATVLAGNTLIKSWAQGRRYRNRSGNGSRTQGLLDSRTKPATLLNAQGAVFERVKPQYEDLPASRFVSIKLFGAKGDGVTDDTRAIQDVFSRACPDEIVYFDHGAYIVSDTIRVPKNIRITGEIWPLILASGAAFSDRLNPKPVFKVGEPGDFGAVEMSDLMFSTAGPQPGAILMEWNVHDSAQGASGMWDVHFRIGGAAGTKLQSDTCAVPMGANITADPSCEAAFLLLHVTKTASLYSENCWFWVSDHELDLPDHARINIYNGRGVLVESQGPVWLYGTSSEHSQIYQYYISDAKDIYLSSIQAETPYYQANPNALKPFPINKAFADPDFASCTTDSCRKSWGLVVRGSRDVLVYGAGLYSFFESNSQECLKTESCQENMVSVEASTGVGLYGLSTKASTNMVTFNNGSVVAQADNRNTFCSTLALFLQP